MSRVGVATPAITAIAIIVVKLLAGSIAYSNASSSPNVATGQTAPVFSHGRTIYLTQAQVDRETDPLHWTNLLFVGALALVVVQHARQNGGNGKNGA
jgi:hypothetical protein